jgi:alkylation response protein AidB-like acyl-CoA dehydrogenase
LPEAYGRRVNAFDAVLAIEELARVSPIAAMLVFKTSVDSIHAVEQFGREDQKKRWS